MKEIGAEASGAHFLFQDGIGGDDEAHIDGYALGTPKGQNAAFLEAPQDFHLDRRREIGDLI